MRAPDRFGPAWGDLSAPGAGPAERKPVSMLVAGSVVAGLVVLVVAGSALLNREASTQLIAPIDPNIETAAIFVGAFTGALLIGAVLMRRLEGRAPAAEDRSALGTLAEPLAAAFLCVIVATWCARGLVELYAFAGLSPHAFPAEFVVVGRDTGRHDHPWFLRLRFGEAGRVFSLRVPERTYDSAQDGETVTLPVETGRGGIQRMVAPDRPIAPEDLHRR